MSADRIVMGLIVVAAVPVNLYPFFYAFRPWMTTSQGRALMIKSLGNVIVIDMSLAFVMFGDYWLRDAVRILGFTLFTVGITYLLASLLTAPGAANYPPFRWRRRR